MKIEVGDYVVLPVSDKKNGIARVTSANDEKRKYTAVVESDDPDKADKSFEFRGREIMANLGKSPVIGDAYKVKIEPLREVISEPLWGEVHLYASMDDDRKKVLHKCMKRAGQALDHMKMPELPLTVEVRNIRGAQLGHYKYRPKAETDILCIRPDASFSQFNYVIGHEYFHGIWARHMTPSMRMRWVRLYHDSVAVQRPSEKDLRSLLDDLVANGDLGSFYKECPPEDQDILKEVFKHMKSVHGIEKKHFQMSLTVGDEVDRYWPKALELGSRETILTPYAKKSPEELASEAFGLKFEGKTLPKKVAEVLDKTLRGLVA